MYCRFACILAVLVVCPASVARAARERPNVVLIMTDDQGWWDLGVTGNPVIETPNLDRLATTGVFFTRFYCSPVCTPTRASLMTGRHFQRTGAIDTYMGRDTLDEREITLGQIFQQAGYRTGLCGKWHLGRYMRYHPNNRGFDEFFGFWQYGYINRYDDSDELFRNRERATTAGYVTDVLTDAAIEFVRANRDRPFFMYVPYNAVHSPHLVPDENINKYLAKGLPLRQARIYGMVERVDANVGRLLATLDETGLAEKTVVIFLSDNGGVSSYYNAGLRGQKGTVWEGGIRSPLLVRWPGHFPSGVRVEAMAQHIDLLPTLCELIGADVPNDRPIDGRSILPLIRNGGGPSPHKYLYHQWSRTRPDPNKEWAIHGPRYKLVNGQLFDLQTDPGEEHDLAAEHPDVVRELRAEFERWFAEVTAGRDYERVPIEVGRDDENPVEIDVVWGEAVGSKVKPRHRRYHRDYIADWTQVQDYVRWKIDVTQAGKYEVTISYSCPPGEEGSRFRFVVGDSSCEGTVRSTGGNDIYCPPVTVGTLELAAGPAWLECRPISIAGTQLMGLHKIWLRRVGESAPQEGGKALSPSNKSPHAVRTACIQMLPATGDPQANIARADRLVREAVLTKGAELIVLPECTLTGYASPGSKGLTLEQSRAMAERVPGPSVEHFARLAAELKVYIVWGLHERRGDRYYNSAVLLSPEGKIEGTYSKVHINKYESQMGWTNGDKFHVWPCRIRGIEFNLGIMICYDREVPEAARCLMALGADIIAVPQATPCTCIFPIHRDQLRVRAYENELYIAMANWGGPDFRGHGMIIAPTGDVLQLGGQDEEILVADLDLQALREHRNRGIYGKHHRRPDAYGPLLIKE